MMGFQVWVISFFQAHLKRCLALAAMERQNIVENHSWFLNGLPSQEKNTNLMREDISLVYSNKIPIKGIKG